MEVSDYISLAAILIAVAFGIFNYRHTRKAFSATIYPEVQMSLSIYGVLQKSREGSGFHVYLKNLSTSYPIIDVQVEVFIRNLERNWRRPRKWLFFYQSKIDLVEAMNNGMAHEDAILDDFLLESFPSMIKEIKPPPNWPLRYVEAPPISVLVKAKYRPAIWKGRHVTSSSKFVIKPIMTNITSKGLNPFWEVEE